MKEYYEKQNLELVVKKCFSLTEVLQGIGLRTAGGNYGTIKRYIHNYGIDITHFNEKEIRANALQNYHKGISIPLEDILVENSNFSRKSLKARLYKLGIKQHQCELCGQGEEWHGRKMSLILDHINGIHNDNRLENLQIVCPNCNATLDTYCGKNNAPKIVKEKSKRGGLRKVVRPDIAVVAAEVAELGYSATGRKYGVSDNAVRKWLK